MNYKKMKERIERKEEAVKNLIEFLAKENDYSSMMTELAIAQSSAMKLAEIARIHGDKGYMQELYTFFITITDLLIWIEPLSDFAKIEISDAEILAVLGNCMSNIFDEEKIAKKEEKAKARKAKHHVEDTIAFHICLQSIEKGLKK